MLKRKNQGVVKKMFLFIVVVVMVLSMSTVSFATETVNKLTSGIAAYIFIVVHFYLIRHNNGYKVGLI